MNEDLLLCAVGTKGKTADLSLCVSPCNPPSAQALETDNIFSRIDLSFNQIEDAGATALSKVIRVCLLSQTFSVLRVFLCVCAGCAYPWACVLVRARISSGVRFRVLVVRSSLSACARLLLCAAVVITLPCARASLRWCPSTWRATTSPRRGPSPSPTT